MVNYHNHYDENANAMLTKQCWEDLFSMEWETFAEFKEMCREVAFKQKNEAP